MARTTLAERQARLDQQRARLQMEENRLKEAGRKARTRRLIEAGGLVEKAGLLDLDSAVLYGALLQVAADARDASRVEQWRIAGGRTFDREAKALAAAKEPLILTFAAELSTTLAAQVRAAGFRWSKVLRHWEGLALHSVAQEIAQAHGGELRRLDASGQAQVAAAATAAE